MRGIALTGLSICVTLAATNMLLLLILNKLSEIHRLMPTDRSGK